MPFFLINQQTGDVIHKLGSGTVLSPKYTRKNASTPALPLFFIRFKPRHRSQRIGSVVISINGSAIANGEHCPLRPQKSGCRRKASVRKCDALSSGIFKS